MKKLILALLLVSGAAFAEPHEPLTICVEPADAVAVYDFMLKQYKASVYEVTASSIKFVNPSGITQQVIFDFSKGCYTTYVIDGELDSK